MWHFGTDFSGTGSGNREGPITDGGQPCMSDTQAYIGTGTGEQGSNCSPNKIIGGASSTSCSPIFFCNLQLKVT